MNKNILTSCCGEQNETEHPDHSKQLHRINRIVGQLEGIKKMISNREYCPKIITQIQATRAALKSLESVVLEKHLGMCVTEAFNSKSQSEANKKLEELMDVFRRG